LYPAIVAGTDERSVFIENCGADGDAAFGESFAGFGNGQRQQRFEIQRIRHGQKYTRLRGKRGCGRFRRRAGKNCWRDAPAEISDDKMRYYFSRQTGTSSLRNVENK
jgi:hypothetical protein